MKVLFICRANAGRSQIAEAFYNSLTGTDDASSAGVNLTNSVNGSNPTIPDLVVQVMKEVGIDVSMKHRDVLTQQMVDAADKVIVITDHEMPEYVANSPKLERWLEIPDAVRTPIEFHRHVRDLVRSRVTQLINTKSV